MGNRTENSQAALRLEGGQLDIKERMREYRVRRWILPVEPGTVSALGQCGIGIYSCRIKVEESEGEMTAEGSGAAVLAGGSGEMKPSIKSDGKVTAGPGDVRVVEFDAAGQNIWQAMRKKSGGWMGELNLPCLHIRRRIWLLIMKVHPVLTVQPGPSGLPQNKEIEQMEE